MSVLLYYQHKDGTFEILLKDYHWLTCGKKKTNKKKHFQPPLRNE